MRRLITTNLVQYLGSLNEPQKKGFKTLLISGESTDPEVQVLLENFELEVVLSGNESRTDPNYIFLDLNKEHQAKESYELIVCNQVFEHLYDIKNALEVISNLSSSGTVVWLDFPVSTFEHGSPDFYTTGIMPEMISQLGAKYSLETHSKGVIGSERHFLFGHLLKLWPTPRQMKSPLFSYFGVEGSLMRKLIFQFSSLPARLLIAISSKEISTSSRFATTGWIILVKS